MFGCARSAPGYISYQSSCMINVVQADSSVAGRPLQEGNDLFKCSLSIVSCGGDVLKTGEKQIAASVHGPNIAKRDKLFP
jgi:hypothetical protein